MNKDYLTVGTHPAESRLEQGALDYVEASPSADPLFRALRKKHFSQGSNWVELAMGGQTVFLTQTGLKIGPIPCRGLLPAFGWESRPFEHPRPLGQSNCDALISQLIERADWDVLQLTSLLPREAALLSQAALGAGIHSADAPFSVRVVTGGVDYASYFERRSTSWNRDWKRTLKKAVSKGFRFETELAWPDIRSLFDVKLIKDANEDYTKSQAFLAFFEEFRGEMKKQGRICEIGVFHGTMLIGFDLGFWNGKVLHAYQTAYHPSYRDDRPGALALEKFIELGLESKASLINFMGDYPYMTHYSKEVLDLRRVSLYAPTLRGRAAATLVALKKKLRR